MTSLLRITSNNMFRPSPSRSFATAASKQLRYSKVSEPNTHFKITLRRSAIALGERKKETLIALGLHRRMQTVYHVHSPETAGKILKVKELVEIENVPARAVRSQSEQRKERKASRGYQVEGTKLGDLAWEASCEFIQCPVILSLTLQIRIPSPLITLSSCELCFFLIHLPLLNSCFHNLQS